MKYLMVFFKYHILKQYIYAIVSVNNLKISHLTEYHPNSFLPKFDFSIESLLIYPKMNMEYGHQSDT